MKTEKVSHYETICTRCGSKLIFNYEEIIFKDALFERGGFIYCPCCKEKIETHRVDVRDCKLVLNTGWIKAIYNGEEDA